MKPGPSTWFFIVALCALGAVAVYHPWNRSGDRPARPADTAPSKGGASSSGNEMPQNEPPTAAGLAYEAAATNKGDIESNTSQAEAPRLSLKQVEKMRELAIAHSTPASQYINAMFDAKNPRANIAATVLHGDLSKGKPDPLWSTTTEQTLRSEMTQLPSNFSNRLEFSQVDCGPSVCEIEAAMRFTSPYQTSQDILDWQSYVYEMLRSPSAQADQLTNPVMILSTTPDDRPLFLVYFRRGQGDSSSGSH